MRDAGIDRDDEVQMRDQGCRVGESPEVVAEMQHIAPLLKQQRIVGADLPLQADESRGDIQERQQDV